LEIDEGEGVGRIGIPGRDLDLRGEVDLSARRNRDERLAVVGASARVGGQGNPCILHPSGVEHDVVAAVGVGEGLKTEFKDRAGGLGRVARLVRQIDGDGLRHERPGRGGRRGRKGVDDQADVGVGLVLGVDQDRGVVEDDTRLLPADQGLEGLVGEAVLDPLAVHHFPQVEVDVVGDILEVVVGDGGRRDRVAVQRRDAG